MTMSWRRIKLLIWKEFLQLRRDRLIVPMLLVAPVLQLFLFGYVVGSDIQNLQLAVLDHDHTAYSRQVTEAFTSTRYFELTARVDTEAELKKVMDGNVAVVAIDIPAGFGDAVTSRRPTTIGVIVDGSDGRISQIAGAYASGITAQLNRDLYGSPGPSKFSISRVDLHTRVLYNPAMRSINTMVPGLLALLILMSTSMVMSQAVVKEREQGTLEQLFVTPISRGEYLIGKLVPYAIVGMAQVTVVFLVGTLWFRVPFRGSLVVVFSALALFLLCTLGMGLLISVLSRTRAQAQQLVLFIQMPQLFLSGFMFPLEALPTWLYLVTFAIPLRYILVIMRASFLKGSSFLALWPQFAALAVFAAVIFAFGLSQFRKQLAD